ncbi:hypothetical protein QTN25_008585 [Entamoeba marina]
MSVVRPLAIQLFHIPAIDSTTNSLETTSFFTNASPLIAYPPRNVSPPLPDNDIESCSSSPTSDFDWSFDF